MFDAWYREKRAGPESARFEFASDKAKAHKALVTKQKSKDKLAAATIGSAGFCETKPLSDLLSMEIYQGYTNTHQMLAQVSLCGFAKRTQ